MQLPTFLQGDSPARLAQGALGGVILTAVIGFGWGGWTLESKAQAMADQRTNEAVVAVLAPICADRFNNAGEAEAKLVALKKVDSWERNAFIIKGGWATFPGSAEPNRNVADACADILNK